MAYMACERCGNWHRADFNCDTAARLITAYLGDCTLCRKQHPPTITCAMEPDWRRWHDGTEVKVREVWDKTLEEAWVMAQAVGRLNNAITLLERTESSIRSHAVSDTKDIPVSASDE